jgi:hypothetical protein
MRVEEIDGGASVRLRSGVLAIGHRPRLRALARMREAGFTHCATVLAENEDPQAVGTAVRELGLGWIWIKLGSTKTLPAPANPEICDGLRALVAILDAGGRVYLHCSAGIHRTGMIAAALLFQLGYDEAEVREALAALRPVTARDMGTQRLDWARSFRPQ